MDRTDQPSTNSEETTSAPTQAGRRRFLGHASKLAPAAIITLNGSAAMAQAQTSAFISIQTDQLNYSRTALDDKDAEVLAAEAAEENNFQTLSDGQPACFDPTGTDGQTSFKPGDRIDITGPTGGVRETTFDAGKGGPGGNCPSGSYLVTTSSFMSFALKT